MKDATGATTRDAAGHATVGWGIAGCGWVARDFFAPAMRQSRTSRLVAAYDCNPQTAAAWGGTTDLAVFLATPGLQAVYIATPNHAHRPLVEAAAGAGLAVLCEKPMAHTLEAARAIAATVHATGTLYATGFDQRFHAAHQTIAAAAHRGDLGTLIAIRLVYACWLGPDFAADNWRIDPDRAGGGAMIDLAPHGLDLAVMIAGSPIARIAALGQSAVQPYAVDDGAMLIARTENQVLVSLHVAYNCPDAYPRRRLEVIGTRAQIVATDTMGQTGGGQVVIHDAESGAARPFPVLDLARSPFLAQIDAFAEAVLGRCPFPFEAAADVQLMTHLIDAQRQLDGSIR